ncbi:MAG: hypothetical protein AAGA35_03205 [Patescibacteria group bacterium]
MGTVHLTHGHHGLFCRKNDIDLEKRLLLTSDMVGMPIYVQEGSPKTIRDSRAKMVWAALEGLMLLEGFDAAVAFDYGTKDELYFMLPYRMWGEITLGEPDNLVVVFSHDTREANSPFRSLYQWLEEHCPDDVEDDEVFFAFEAQWRDPEKWHQFYRSRIERRIGGLRGSAEEHRTKAISLDGVAKTLESALA